MGPRVKGQKYDLRDIQKMACEKGELDASFSLPSYSAGYDESADGGYNSKSKKEIMDQRNLEMIENNDWRDDNEFKPHVHRQEREKKGEFEDLGLNWRSSIQRKNESFDTTDSNWRSSEGRNGGLNKQSNNDDGRWRNNNRDDAKKVGGVVDTRPDYLKNRFKKKQDDTYAKTADFVNKATVGAVAAPTRTLLNDKGDTLKSLSMNKATDIKPKRIDNDSKSKLKEKRREVMENISKTKHLDEEYIKLYTAPIDEMEQYESNLWKYFCNQEKLEKNSLPKNYEIPSKACVEKIIFLSESEILSTELANSVIPLSKVAHIIVLINSAANSIEDLRLFIIAIRDVLLLFLGAQKTNYIPVQLCFLVEIQKAACAIKFPNIDASCSLIEGFWLTLYEEGIISYEIFMDWFNLKFPWLETVKGRNTALFQLLNFYDWLSAKEDNNIDIDSEEEFGNELVHY